MKGILYIVATPIGNLEDITLRALRVLKEADLIAAEDTRHTRKLLSHFEISKPLISYWSAKEKTKAEEVIRHLKDGKTVALVSDSGTPGISDPGAIVVKRAVEEGIPVVPVPGPSALTAALSVASMPGEFVFLGFLSAKRNQRRKKLEELKYEKRNLIFYESPHRLLDCLEDMIEILGDREAVLCHELTKINESLHRGKLSEIVDEISEESIAGEYVIIVKGSEKGASYEDARKEAIELMKKGMRRKDAVRKIASQYGLSQKELYDLTLKEAEDAT